MSHHYPRIRIDPNYGCPLVREGLRITFYMRHSHEEIVQEVLRSLETYLRAIHPRTLGWYTNYEGELQKLDDAGWSFTRRELREHNCPIIWLYDVPTMSVDQSAYRFEYYGKDFQSPHAVNQPNATCAVSFWLPTEFLEEHGPSRVRELALELAAPLPFCSGHVGLSFNGELDIIGVPQEVAKYCFRYPGIDVGDLEDISWNVGTRVRGPHWLTFLGQPVLGELGGPEALRARLHSPGTTVQELEGDRAVVTLGPWPEAGDAERGDTLPAYRELARVLEPWLFLSPRDTLLGLTPEQTRRWERRFLDPLPPP